MKSFQNYLYEQKKVYEFRVTVAGTDSKDLNTDSIKRALDAYQVESVSKPKRMPIQEHKKFPKLGPCECYVFEVTLNYPTTTQQVYQLIYERAFINPDCVCVETKGQAENEDAVQERIDNQGPVLTEPELQTEEGQSLAGQARVGSLLKELESRKYEIAGSDTTVGGEKDPSYGKSSNELPIGTTSPVGTHQNKIPSPVKGQK